MNDMNENGVLTANPNGVSIQLDASAIENQNITIQIKTTPTIKPAVSPNDLRRFPPKIEDVNDMTFTPSEIVNIRIHIFALMFFKFGLENLKGSFKANLTNRFDMLGTNHTFEMVGNFDGAFYTAQIIGNMLPASLLARFRVKAVLSCTSAVLAIAASVLLAIEGVTGGTILPKGTGAGDKELFRTYFGDYKTLNVMPVWVLAGVSWGMIDTMRRVMPPRIINNNEAKLRKLNALVHIFYEIAGTVANLLNGLVLVPGVGSNFGALPAPFAFSLAACTWYLLKITDIKTSKSPEGFVAKRLKLNSPTLFANYCINVVTTVPREWCKGLWFGFKTIACSLSYVWLIPGFSLALYGHRYLEDQLIKKIAARYFGVNVWSEITMAGLNFGEMAGAGFVFFYNDVVKTPIPWLRIDAVTLLIMWYLGFWYPERNDIRQPFILAGSLLFVTVGWAAGDVSINAFIQSQMKRLQGKREDIDVTASCVGFLNVVYVVTYAILGNQLGRYMDRMWKKDNPPDTPPQSEAAGPNTHRAIMNLSGCQFTVLAVIIFASTFIPYGSRQWNPKSLGRPAEDGNAIDEEQHSNSETSGKENVTQAIVAEITVPDKAVVAVSTDPV